MASVALVTDSTACLPPHYIHQYQITVLPFSFIFGDKLYLDDENARHEVFYRLLEEMGQPPKTSPPSPGAYLDAFTTLARQHKQILCVTLHSGLSSLYNSARTAAQNAMEANPGLQISVVDSGTASMAAGFVTLAAAEAAERNATLAEVAQAAEEAKKRVQLIAVLDTLEYLARSRRIPMIAAWAGRLVNMKPLLSITGGSVKMQGATFSAAGGQRKIIKVIKEKTRGASRKLRIAVVHTDSPAKAQQFKNHLESELHPKELLVCPFTPVMGLYTGPGLLGAAYYLE